VKRLTNVALIGLVAVGLSIPVVLDWRSELLKRLQQCHREVPTGGRQHFTSPCESMRFRLLGLIGISRAVLESTLGAADSCFDRVAGSPKDKKCLQPGWSLYYLPAGSLGGGPNLVCWSGGGETCHILFWMLTP
jgi:hypothetical protein